ncbi:peptidylprolyl isomerase [Paracoccus aestuarii]|uniref:Peptidylprolyl isomerase n=1 Tax=Paracoccus aestuarii TaxID=453842 RepID=A0A418ZT96_9RHOB|nr:peptidylprolyl isomerase [Paracoccus aestuarii]RJL01430.1 peptidylprolyl isomerase [Paracoccus aestuarii]WCQ98233.1 SurA N-terminal domain-containing protein [Paracoccus aestuarii]
MSKLRTKGKSTVVWILMGLMVLGLGGFGVTSFSGGSSEVASVGETKVTADDYARALQSELRAIAQQTGQPVTMQQAQQMGLPQMVQANLIASAALAEQARRIGVSVGDQQVAQTIMQAGAFRGPTGNFDRAAYSEILRRERLTEAEFERTVREDEARLMLQRAVTGGVAAPAPMVDQTARWLLETRDIAWIELTEDDLPEPVAEPDEATLRAWHEANGDRFTAPETRAITYAWITPDMLSREVQLDEEALRAVYDQNIAQFQRPERRLVSRLVFPDAEAAEAARAAIDAGEQPFEAFVIQRGLSLDDVDLGEVTAANLGSAGEPVFAAEETGVIGPIQTDLGPALFSVNAIMDPVDIPFEEARDDLRGEAALSAAARQIQARTLEYEDILAGGATLEELAEQSELQLGRIDWSAEAEPAEGSIAGYTAFRDRAAEIGTTDFPQIFELADGGVFALRLDEVVPPTLRPFEEVEAEVLADWRRAEVQRLLLARAGEIGLAANSEGMEDAMDWTLEEGLSRNEWMDGLPPQLLARAFELDEPGDAEAVDAGDRVFLVRLDQVNDADLSGDDAADILAGVRARLNQSLQIDLFDFYARHAQRESQISVNQSAINAINAQVQ